MFLQNRLKFNGDVKSKSQCSHAHSPERQRKLSYLVLKLSRFQMRSSTACLLVHITWLDGTRLGSSTLKQTKLPDGWKNLFWSGGWIHLDQEDESIWIRRMNPFGSGGWIHLDQEDESIWIRRMNPFGSGAEVTVSRARTRGITNCSGSMISYSSLKTGNPARTRMTSLSQLHNNSAEWPCRSSE